MQTKFYLKHLDTTEAERLRATLKQVSGVASIEISERRGKVVVDYSAEKTTPREIREVALGAGFAPSDVPFDQEGAAEFSKSITTTLKRAAGRCAFHLCNRVPASKKLLRHLGMRTRKEWFRGLQAKVQIPGGRSLRLSSVGENYLSFQVFWKGTEYYEPVTSLVLSWFGRVTPL